MASEFQLNIGHFHITLWHWILLKPSLSSEFVTVLWPGKGYVASLLLGGSRNSDSLLGLHWCLWRVLYSILAPACSPSMLCRSCPCTTRWWWKSKPSTRPLLKPYLLGDENWFLLQRGGTPVVSTASVAGVEGGSVTNWQGWRLSSLLGLLWSKPPWPKCWVPLCILERMDVLVSSLAFDDPSQGRATVFQWCLARIEQLLLEHFLSC